MFNAIKSLLPNRNEKASSLLTPQKGKIGSLSIIDPSSAIKSSGSDMFSRDVLSFISDNTGGINGGYTEQQLLGAYLSSVYMFAALQRVANLISRVKIVAEIEQDGSYVRAPQNYHINKILENDTPDLLARLWLNYAVYGSAVAYKVKSRKAVTEEARGTPIFDYKDGAVAGLLALDKPMWDFDEDYTYGEIRGLNVVQYAGTNNLLGDRTYLEREEFIFITDWNPEDPNRGRSRVSIAIHEAVANASIAKWMSEYFTRGAMPFIMVSMEEDPQLITENDLKKYKRQFEEYWQGLGSSLRSVFFDRKINVEQVGIAASEIGAPDLNETALEGIASVVGIDRKLIVTTDGGAYAEHVQLVKRAWEDTVIPLATKFLSAFNRDLGLPANMRLVLDLSEISELDADRDERSGTEISVYESGLQTYNEARTRLKMPPVKELDAWFYYDGKPTPLNKFLRLAEIPHDDVRSYAIELWDSNLAKRSEVLYLLGRKLAKGERDGYKKDIEEQYDFVQGLWESDLLTRKQVLTVLGFETPYEVEDGYRSELERGADYGEFITKLWSDNLLTRSQTMQLLGLDVEVPKNTPDGYADEIGNRKDNIMSYWGENLMTRKQAMESLGITAPVNMIDGFNSEVDAKTAEIAEKQNKMIEFYSQLWGEDLITKSQILERFSIPMPTDAVDGYKSEVETISGALAEKQAEILTADPEVEEIPTRSIMTDRKQLSNHEINFNRRYEEIDEGTKLALPNLNQSAILEAEEDYLQLLHEDNVNPLLGSYGDEVDVLPDQSLPHAPDSTDPIYDTEEELTPERTFEYESIATDTEANSEFILEDFDFNEDEILSLLSEKKSQNLYISLWLGNNQEIRDIQDEYKKLLADRTDIDWQNPNEFHITLFYSDNVNEEEYNKVKNVLPKEADAFTIDIDRTDMFFNDNTNVLFLKVRESDKLLYLQQRIATAFSTFGISFSEFSVPGNYHPHITLAYIPKDIDVPMQEDLNLSIYPETVYIGRDDYDMFDKIVLKKHSKIKSYQGNQQEELLTWRKATIKSGIKKGLKFETQYLPENIVQALKEKLAGANPENKQEIHNLFDEVKKEIDNE